MCVRRCIRILLSFCMLAGISCSGSHSKVVVNYLWQDPPGKTATVFAPGIISTDKMEHSAPIFSPDGSVVLWTVVPDGFSGPAYLMEMTYREGDWSSPFRASINDSLTDTYYPSFSVDGKTLYFSSRRKVPATFMPQGDIRIWQVTREKNGWGNPVPMETSLSRGSEFAHSVTRDGTIYFSSGFLEDPSKNRSGWSIFKASPHHPKHRKTESLPYSINSLGYEDGPFIAPDESFLIFESDRPEGMGGTDLYISFRNKADLWSVPVSMGPSINSPYFERFARLSPDGKYLFFGTSRDEKEGHPGFDIYWIDAGIIGELKQSVARSNPIDNAIGKALLGAMDESAWKQASTHLNKWLKTHPDDRDAIFSYVLTLKKEGRLKEAVEFLRGHQSAFPQNSNYILEMASLHLGLGDQAEAENLLAPMFLDKDQFYNRYNYIANSLFDMAQYATSDIYFNKAMNINMWSYGYFRRAREYALLKEYDLAYAQLTMAIENGFIDRPSFESEAAFAPLLGSDKWQVLMDQLD